jgi:hypothetical protein
MKLNNGRVARTAGLVIMYAIAAAAIQNTTWEGFMKVVVSLLVILAGAFAAAMAADYDQGE